MDEIKPKVGVGQAAFGMTPAEVKAILGAEAEWQEWMEGNLNDSLLYPGMIIGFDKYDAYGPLSYGRVREFRLHQDSSATLFGEKLMGMPGNRLLQSLRANGHVVNEEHAGYLLVASQRIAFDVDETDRICGAEIWEDPVRLQEQR